MNQVKLVSVYLFSFLYNASMMVIMIHILLRYVVEDIIIFEDYSSNRAREAQANTAPFFSDAGLRKFVLANELFVPRPYFKRHLTRFTKDSQRSSIYSLKKVIKTEIKVENLKLHTFIVNFSKRAKRFFDLFAFYIDNQLISKSSSKSSRYRFFLNFATSKANRDWLTLILNMAHLYQNKTVNTLIVSALRSQQVQAELEDSINITYGILDNIFQYWILRMC